MRTILVALIGAIALTSASAVSAGPGDSRDAAATLVRILEERGLRAFAAEHPDAPGTFSAVLLIPGVQLLGITTTYPPADQLRQVIAAGDYQQAYVDLQTAGAREGRVFVQDLAADGLRANSRDGEPSDVVSRDAHRDIAYNGDWTRQQLTKAAYDDTFARDEKHYAEMLLLLTAAANDAPPGSQHLAAKPAP